MRAKWFLLFVILLLPLVALSAEEADANQTITIDSVSYDITTGNLSYAGLVPTMGSGTITVILEGVGITEPLSKDETVAAGTYSGLMDVGLLERGSYTLKVETSSSGYESGLRHFSIDGLIRFVEVVFDQNEMKVTFSGMTNRDAVDVSLINGKNSSNCMHLIPQNGVFSGEIVVDGELLSDKLSISAVESGFYDYKKVDIGSYVVLDKTKTKYDSGTVFWEGISSEEVVLIELLDTSNKVVFHSLLDVVDGKIDGERSVYLNSGNYRLKAIGIKDSTLFDVTTISVPSSGSSTVTSSVRLMNSDDANVIVFKDYTRSISFVLTNCTNDQVIVTSNNGSVVQVLSQGTLDKSNQITLKGLAVGSAEIKVTPPNGTPIFLNITVKEDTGTPNNLYYLFIQFKEGDTTGAIGMNDLDCKKGFWVKGHGSSAKEALREACSENGWQLSFDERFYDGWLDKFMDLPTINNNDGTYTYWAQYHWDGSKWLYNDYALGYLKTTEYRYVALVYSTTTEGVSSTNLGVTPADIPDYLKEQGGADPNPGDNPSSSTTTNPDGTQTTEVIYSDGSKTETTTEKPTTTKDKDGNTTTVTPSKTTNYDSDGNVIGSSESTKTEIKNKDGTEQTIEVEKSKDKDGNVTGSTEVSETKDKDGNVTSASNVVKDAEGNEITYEKTETVPEKTVTDDDGNQVTESSVKTDVKDETGKVTVTEESNKEIIATDGSKVTEKVKAENVTASDGSTISTKVTESTKEDADSIISSVQTETKTAGGKESSEKTVVAESKDGNVISTVDIPTDADKAEIVTVVKAGSEDGVASVSKELVEQAVAIQEKVSDAISEDVKEQTKVIQVESETVDASLTVSQDAVKAVSDSGSELKMVSQDGSMQISKEILENLSDVDDVTISFSKSEDAVKEKMTDAQKGAVDENATVLELKITSGDTSLGDRLGGTLTVTVKHKQAEGMVAVAYYIADDGTKEKLNGTYDPEKEEMSFETTHCSIYAVVDESSEPDPVPGPIVDPDEPSSGDKDDGMMLYIGIAIAVIAAIAVAGVLYMRRT